MAVNHLSKWLRPEGLSRLIMKDFLGLLAERGGRFLIGLIDNMFWSGRLLVASTPLKTN